MRRIFMACMLFAMPAYGQDWQQIGRDDEMRNMQIQMDTQRDEMLHEQQMRDAQADAQRIDAQLASERQADMDRQRQQDRMDDSGMIERPGFGR